MNYTQNRIDELKLIIENAQRELRHIELKSENPSTRFINAMACTMLQGHPYRCGCDW